MLLFLFIILGGVFVNLRINFFLLDLFFLGLLFWDCMERDCCELLFLVFWIWSVLVYCEMFLVLSFVSMGGVVWVICNVLLGLWKKLFRLWELVVFCDFFWFWFWLCLKSFFIIWFFFDFLLLFCIEMVGGLFFIIEFVFVYVV